MTKKKIILVGAGGHARVVYDALIKIYHDIEVFVCDELVSQKDKFFFDNKIYMLSADCKNKLDTSDFHVAIGNNNVRQRIYNNLHSLEFQPMTVIHPQSTLACNISISTGCFIAANSIVGPCSKIGQGVIVNHAAVVDHDCIIEDWVHVGPNATLGGGVSIGARSLIGSGSTILPGVRVGRDCIIGSGAVVTKNIASNTTAIGMPAKGNSNE